MVGGILMMIQYFIPHGISQTIFEHYTDWGPIVGVFALILGLGSLIRVHTHKIRRKGKNWQYSYAILIPLLLMPLFGLILPASLAGGREAPGIFHFLFMNIQVPIQATMFSLLAFYIASAAFSKCGLQGFQSQIGSGHRSPACSSDSDAGSGTRW